MKIVVTGGRDKKGEQYEQLVNKVMFAICENPVYVGDCPTGIDRYVLNYCEFSDGFRMFRADWNKHGKAAGPIRNREMLEAAGKDAIVIAFPGGRDTENCVKQAKELGMIVLRVEL